MGIDLDRKLKKLGLKGKKPLKWWGPDLVPNEGKTSFYYGKNLKDIVEVVEAYPPCLLIVEEVKLNEKRTQANIRIEGLPKGGINLINFSHYHIGPSYQYVLSHDSYSNDFGSDSFERVVKVATISFLRKK